MLRVYPGKKMRFLRLRMCLRLHAHLLSTVRPVLRKPVAKYEGLGTKVQVLSHL